MKFHHHFDAKFRRASTIYQLTNPLNVGALKKKGWMKKFDVLPKDEALSVSRFDLKYPTSCPNLKDLVLKFLIMK